MKSVSIDQLTKNPELVTASGDEAIEVTHQGQLVGFIGSGTRFPHWEWEVTGDEDYVDNGGATDPARIQEINDAVDNDYWGD